MIQHQQMRSIKVFPVKQAMKISNQQKKKKKISSSNEVTQSENNATKKNTCFICLRKINEIYF